MAALIQSFDFYTNRQVLVSCGNCNDTHGWYEFDPDTYHTSWVACDECD